MSVCFCVPGGSGRCPTPTLATSPRGRGARHLNIPVRTRSCDDAKPRRSHHVARSRLIKPGFFENEDLCSLPYEARLLFAGLWTIADRAGRLEDRPIRIRAKLFPYDTIDVDALLNALQSKGFVRRYTVKTERYLAVIKFETHQHPHIKEPLSTIPAPDQHQTSSVLAPIQHYTSPAVIDPVSRSGNRDMNLTKDLDPPRPSPSISPELAKKIRQVEITDARPRSRKRFN